MYSVYTVATQNTRGLKSLLQSASDANIQVNIRGLGMSWSQLGKKCWKWRAEQFIDIANSSNTDWILILDAYDTLLNSKADQLIKNIISDLELRKVDCFISGEKIIDWCGPNCQELLFFKGWFANPGVFLAKKHIIKQIFGSFLLDTELDDQYYINSYINENKNSSILVDTAQTLCQTIVKEKCLRDSAVYHFPGPWTDIGWSNTYNNLVNKKNKPKFQMIPYTLIKKITKADSALVILVFQTCLYLFLLYIQYKHIFIIFTLPFIIYYCIHEYQTFT